MPVIHLVSALLRAVVQRQIVRLEKWVPPTFLIALRKVRGSAGVMFACDGRNIAPKTELLQSMELGGIERHGK